jgi:hypothetical protein
MEYAIDFVTHSERPFFEESAGSRPPPRYAAFVALRDAYGRIQPAWSPQGIGFIEQTGAVQGRVIIRDADHVASENRLRFHEGQFPQVVAEPDASPSPWAAELHELRENLGLPITALVEALNVTRPAFYAWLRGEQPNRSNQRRIRVLSEVSEFWKGLNVGPMSRHWNLPAPSGGADLRATLMRADLSSEIFRSVLEKMGIGRRLLPPRASRPVLLDRASKAHRSFARRKAWGTTPDDVE